MTFRKIFLFFSFLFIFQTSYGGGFRRLAINDTSNKAEIAQFLDGLDSLVTSWYVQQSLSRSMIMTTFDTSSPTFPDSVYAKRLSQIPSLIQLPFNDNVKAFIFLYTKQKKEKVQIMLGLSSYYFPMIEEILDSYDMPLDLKYLAIIESALNPRAVSRVGATGMWQFMYATGRMYNLKINSLVDDRRDPVKATHAAAAFLKDLYDIYGDWTLAIAAYNCGPGNVNKAIRRSGGKTNFWEIYYYLPKETRGYVPAFIAAAYLMNYYSEHNLVPASIDLPVHWDTVLVNKNLHLQQIADMLNIPIQQLRDLNPQYRKDIIPGNNITSCVKLPFNYTTQFIAVQDSIYTYKDTLYFKLKEATIAKYYNSKITNEASYNEMVMRFHKVKSGENLGLIAKKYKVTVSDLKYWNNLKGSVVRSGQKIIVYLPTKEKKSTKDKEDTTAIAKNETENKSQKQTKTKETLKTTATADTVKKSITVVSNKNPSPKEDAAEFVTYIVKSGDTLWEIARKFQGVTEQDIMKLNSISNADRIVPGQVLKIQKKG